MKQKLIFLLLISIGFHSSFVFAQRTQQEDSIDTRQKFGLRLGIDISKPVRSFLEEDYQGLELTGDYRLYENVYLAGELGNEQNVISEANVTASAKGSYIKLGANYNVYNNWAGMDNLIFAGIRYGFASFSSELREFSIYTTDPYFEPDVRTVAREFSNLTAGWVELQLGIKVEVLNNVFLGTHVQLKRRVNQTQPNNFDNLYIPGFNRTYDNSTFGVGYGYSISYLIPLYKS
ncbi:DUF6048 family protein [Salinimicrobium oceani]|uniref:Outer membrane protein beta-barrel domain-containing protein n=1 Tax=Salinimicrobium oceani TaxID=2722702 RepID=A0ABX1D5R5_9FLAO|nr:DUF6048 family protein [Salinimicrobium oceani]NJW54113.1 hypothetical protein [Salinimicrobium oceani]